MGHGRRLCFPFPSKEWGTQTIQPAFPRMCMRCLILFFCSVSHSLWQLNTQYISVTHSISVFLTPPVLLLPLFSPFTSSEQLPALPLLFSFHFFAAPSFLVLCLRPLIRFGPDAISFGPVCGGAPPWLAEYPGKALRLCRRSSNRVSRA